MLIDMLVEGLIEGKSCNFDWEADDLIVIPLENQIIVGLNQGIESIHRNVFLDKGSSELPQRTVFNLVLSIVVR